MQSETDFLLQIAARPDDLGLRRVFSDWLNEQGDPRGEVMALWMQPQLSTADHRRIARLVARHAHSWLGPLGSALQKKNGFVFEGGFLREARFLGGLPSETWSLLAGEPRLVLLRSLAIGFHRRTASVGEFLAHPILRRVERLEADVGVLVGARPSFAPRWLHAFAWDSRQDLQRLAEQPVMASVRQLTLSTNDMINGDTATEWADAVVASGLCKTVKLIDLVTQDRTIEGAARWLLLARRRLRGEARGTVEEWAAHYARVALTLSGDHFERMVVELGDERGEMGLPARIAAAGALLALLDDGEIQSVEIRGPGLRGAELDTLRAAARRLKTLRRFTVGGRLIEP